MRGCERPPPARGGLYCLGARLRYQSCSTRPCPSHQDFRAEQCRAYNGVSHNITDLPSGVSWTAKLTDCKSPHWPPLASLLLTNPPSLSVLPSERCSLYCQVEHSSAYYLLASQVVDGTPCSLSSDDLCVGGSCVEAGCDRVLGSRARPDQCSVCGGDGTTCRLTTGSAPSSQYGYNTVVRIPAGAANIRVSQVSWSGSARDHNYIAARDSQSGRYLINGGFILSMYSSQIEYGGVMLDYSGSDVVTETLRCDKPLTKDLIVELLSVGSLQPPQLTYSYWRSYPSQKSRNRKKDKSVKRRRRRHRKYYRKLAWKVGRWTKVGFHLSKYCREKADS